MKLQDLDKIEKKYEELKKELERAEDELITSKVVGYNFIPVNPWLGRFIGFDAALMLGVIYEKSAYLKHTSNFLKRGIPMTINYVKEITGMGEERQKKAIKVLQEHGLIEYWTRGSFPKRRFFSIKTGKYKEFNEKLTTFIEAEVKKSKEFKETFRKDMRHLNEEWLEKQNQYSTANIQYALGACYAAPTKEDLNKFKSFTF